MATPLLIAEVKIKSPFGYLSGSTWNELFNIAEPAGDVISIHTDPRWGGSFSDISRARQWTKKPILAKGIHSNNDDIKQAFDLGADYVLCVGRLDGLFNDNVWFEPSSLLQLQHLSPRTRVVWNQRCLTTGGSNAVSFAQARAVWPHWLCQASNVRTKSDVSIQADAVLVGTNLLRYLGS